jgi:hypothetical protein
MKTGETEDERKKKRQQFIFIETSIYEGAIMLIIFFSFLTV